MTDEAWSTCMSTERRYRTAREAVRMADKLVVAARRKRGRRESYRGAPLFHAALIEVAREKSGGRHRRPGGSKPKGSPPPLRR